MYITYLHQYFNTPNMHGGTRSYELARRLVGQGHRVRMLTSWREQDGRRDWFVTDESGIEVHWLPVPYDNAMSYPRRLHAFGRFAIGAARRAASLSSDLVFATSTPLTIALPAVYAARRQRCPMVFEVRDLWPEMPIAVGALRHSGLIRLARELERFAYRNASRVVALSPGMRDGVAATGYDPQRIRVIPNSCDLELFAPDPATAERFRQAHPELADGRILLYAGTLGRINGVEYLARLAAACRDAVPSLRIVIIGDGAEVEKVRQLSSKLGVLGQNLFMYPPTTKQGIVDAFAAADLATSCFIELPEMEKNSANKFFDALASGTPIAINYGGWQAELIEQAGVGLVLGRDPSQAALQLREWFADSAGQKRAAAKALELACTRFSRDRLTDELEALLKETLHESDIGERQHQV
ncbi:glycosyltransferase family 4 protein [Halomonas kalidii]|uniref:Glycosyltransferase family 4 protein n=1 Tax=Halomonas kalidii TaxID=3043293 RepID=A0ABT6VJM7_9GAMM|nr:glycosyltransferase family 4 protein [Halomonas kalidii]MDI5934166.1 glycosyltransferase family 4 protein [Halomonas kalidii]